MLINTDEEEDEDEDEDVDGDEGDGSGGKKKKKKKKRIGGRKVRGKLSQKTQDFQVSKMCLFVYLVK